MLVYTHFSMYHTAMHREISTFREAFWRDDNCFIYEWYDKIKHTGEKFGHDLNSDTRFYELWWIDGDLSKVRKVWLCDPVEWGVNITYYPDREESIIWSIENPDTIYEKKALEQRTRFPDKNESNRIWSQGTPEGLEKFQEKFWENHDKKEREREWKKPDSDGVYKESKDGNHEWGEASGRRGDEDWNENWDKTPETLYEEDNHQNPNGKWGNIHAKDGTDEYSVQWIGRKPEFGGNNGNSVPLETIGSQLWALFQNLKGNLQDKIENIDYSEADPAIKDAFAEIKRDLEAITVSSELDPNDSITAIRLLEALRERLDAAEKSLNPGAKLFKEPIQESVKTLHEILNFYNYSAHRSESTARELTEIALEIVQKIDEGSSDSLLPEISRLFFDLEKCKQDLLRKNQEGERNALKLLLEQAKADQLVTGITLNFLSSTFGNEEEKTSAAETLKNAMKLLKEALSETPSVKLLSSTIQEYLPLRTKESDLIEKLLERLKQELSAKDQDLQNALKILLDQAKVDQHATAVVLTYLAGEFGSEEEKTTAAETPARALQILEAPHPEESASSALASTIQDYLPLRTEETQLTEALLDKFKQDQLKKAQDAENALNASLEQARADQKVTALTLKYLADEFGNEEEKAQAAGALEKARKLLEGPSAHKIPSSILGEYLPLRTEESELIEKLMDRGKIRPETLGDIRKALELADMVAERLIKKEVPGSLQELRKQLEALPDKPNIAGVLKDLIKFQQIDLDLISEDTGASEREIQEALVRRMLEDTLKLIEEEAAKDRDETQVVFEELFKLAGKDEDKENSRKLMEEREIPREESKDSANIGEAIKRNLKKLLPARTAQSRLQKKLLDGAGGIREGIDRIDNTTENLLDQCVNELERSIPADDVEATEKLNQIKKIAEENRVVPGSSISECIDRIEKRLDCLKNIQGLEKELRDKLQSAIDALQKSLEALKKSEEDRIRLESENKGADEELRKAQELIRKLKGDLRKKALQRCCQIFKDKESEHFKRWLDTISIPLIQIDDSETIASSAIEEEEEEKILKNDYIVADQLLNQENLMLIETNPIMISFKLIEGKTDRPMTYLNVFKFLEDIMDKKYETDVRDTKDLRQMRSMTEFVMESLQRQFGIQALALKFLGQFIPGFYQIFNEGHKYAIFFARLLQLFHPEPVPYSLALFLVKARMDFHPLIDKYERVIHDQGQKKALDKKKAETHGRSAYEAAGTGGLAFVSDVIELVYTMFAGDRVSGTRALEIMKPENISQEDFVCFKICHKMAKLGNTPEMIFNLLDKDGGGTISDKEFITGIKKDLDLWISDNNIIKLLVLLDPTGKGEVSKEIFTFKINMKTFADWGKSPNWTISKATFLTGMVEIYKHNQRKLSAHVNPNFGRFGRPGLNKDEFEELLLMYEPTLSVYEIEKLFIESLAIDPAAGGASFRSTCSIMSKYGFGFLRPFKIKELMAELSGRKSTIDVSLSMPADGAFHKKGKSNTIVEESKTLKPSRTLLEAPQADMDETNKSPRSRIAKKLVKK